jgi:squalene-hopene/tetraprenyl-beta-curcumene cyclase
MKVVWRTFAVGLTLALVLAQSGRAGDGSVGANPKDVQAVAEKALAFLKAAQEPSGAFSPKRAGPGITAVVVAGLLRAGYGPDEPVVSKGLEYLLKSIKEDGGIYDKFLANYTTSVAIMALKEANQGGKYDAILKKAAAFLKTIQQDTALTNPTHGGFGYDKGSRPDMSNTGFSVEALVAAGIPKDDPVIQKALKFISRAQNLPGEENDQEFAKKTSKDDYGGLVYNPLDTKSKRDATPEGGLRSAGAMTYSGLKSFLYAGVSKTDRRVAAAIDWIRRHYTLKENPGLGKSGLFYYYHTFAKALQAWGEDRFEDSTKVKHDWRRELFEELRSQQQRDGSWRNAGDKAFGEGDPNLATGFALLSLSYCKAPRK